MTARPVINRSTMEETTRLKTYSHAGTVCIKRNTLDSKIIKMLPG